MRKEAEAFRLRVEEHSQQDCEGPNDREHMDSWEIESSPSPTINFAQAPRILRSETPDARHTTTHPPFSIRQV